MFYRSRVKSEADAAAPLVRTLQQLVGISSRHQCDIVEIELNRVRLHLWPRRFPEIASVIDRYSTEHGGL